ncbi:hypothetical protein D3C79_528040 [compost metagenome]
MLLGFLELADVSHCHDQGRGAIQFEGFGRGQAREQLPIAAPEAHFQVADTALVQAFQYGRTGTGNTPQVQLGGGATEHLAGGEADLFFERFVDLQQAAVAVASDQQDVRTLLEHRGEFLFRQAQGVFGALGLADVDHQAAHKWPVAMLDHADDVAHPEGLAIGPDHAVIEAVVAAAGRFTFTEGLGPQCVVRVQDAAPETGL